MKWVKTFEAYSKRKKITLNDTKIKEDVNDIFIELIDDGFIYDLKSGVLGTSKYKEHQVETLYLVIAKLGNTSLSNIDLFDTVYFDDTLQLFKQNEVREYVLMFVDYMKGLWGEDIEVELLNDTVSRKQIPDKNDSDYYIDKYFVRIKKRL